MFKILKSQFEETKLTLKNVEENIKRITGRDPDQYAITAAGNVKLKTEGKFPGNTNTFQQRKRPFSLSNRFGKQVKEKEEEEIVADEESPDEDGPIKKPAIQSTVVATRRTIRSRRDTIQEQNSDSRGLARNRRMFGFVLGTLQKFQNEESRHKIQADKRAEVDKKVEEAAEKEKEQMKKEKEQMFQMRREKQTQMRCLEKKLEIAEVHEAWEQSHKLLANFILTEAKPPIMYLPAKPTAKSRKVLEASQQQVLARLKTRREAMEKELSEVDNWYTKEENGNQADEAGVDENMPLQDENELHDIVDGDEQPMLITVENQAPLTVDNGEQHTLDNGEIDTEIVVKTEIEDQPIKEETEIPVAEHTSLPEEFEPIYDE